MKKAIAKPQTRKFLFIQEEITLKQPWSKDPQKGKKNGCWLALNEDGTKHIVQDRNGLPKGWGLVKENELTITCFKKDVYVEVASEGDITLNTLDGVMSYVNKGKGYIVYNELNGEVDYDDPWFMTEEKFNKKYELDKRKTVS